MSRFVEMLERMGHHVARFGWHDGVTWLPPIDPNLIDAGDPEDPSDAPVLVDA